MQVFELHQRLSQAKSIDELNKTITRYFGKQAISSIAFTYYQKHTKSGSKLRYHWVSAQLKLWHEYYLESNYADIDRTLENSHNRVLPQFWDVRLQLSKAKNNREKTLRLESIDYGIDKGLNIPLHGPDGDFMVLVIHQRIDEQGLTDWQQKQFEWMPMLQCYYHHLLMHLDVKRIETNSLTKREQQCLELTSKGLRVDAIAMQLKITARTVNFHLQNANKKLGGNNKYHSILKLTSMNMSIQDDIYRNFTSPNITIS
jgi:DNA-binding CsgD family transcriptional regulator